jgi:hypothetical protein
MQNRFKTNQLSPKHKLHPRELHHLPYILNLRSWRFGHIQMQSSGLVAFVCNKTDFFCSSGAPQTFHSPSLYHSCRITSDGKVSTRGVDCWGVVRLGIPVWIDLNSPPAGTSNLPSAAILANQEIQICSNFQTRWLLKEASFMYLFERYRLKPRFVFERVDAPANVIRRC